MLHMLYSYKFTLNSISIGVRYFTAPIPTNPSVVALGDLGHCVCQVHTLYTGHTHRQYLHGAQLCYRGWGGGAIDMFYSDRMHFEFVCV